MMSIEITINHTAGAARCAARLAPMAMLFTQGPTTVPTALASTGAR